MTVYNEAKTQILTDYDLRKGYLKADKRFIAHHEAVTEIPAVSTEQNAQAQAANGATVEQIGGKWYSITEYENGGKDAVEIKATPAILAKEAYDEEEDIQVYVPYTEEELTERANRKRIAELKQLLANTDYQAIKYAEGELTAEEYAEIKAQRKAWRVEINELETQIGE